MNGKFANAVKLPSGSEVENGRPFINRAQLMLSEIAVDGIIEAGLEWYAENR